MFQYCLLRLSGDRNAAEEATSDTFMVLFRKWDELDLAGNVAGWLIRSADWCIKHQREKYGGYYGRVVPIDDDAERTLHDPTAGVDDSLAAAELVERVEAALPPSYAKLFHLRYVEGMTVADAARALGENYPAVRFRSVRLERALDGIREKIRQGKF